MGQCSITSSIAIELQTHGSEVRLRNDYVREIPESERKSLLAAGPTGTALGIGLDEPIVEDQGSDVAARREPVLYPLQVIRWSHESIFDYPCNDARRAAGRETDMIVPAVKMAGEANDLLLSGEARATRSARCVASVPVTVKRTRSADGIIR